MFNITGYAVPTDLAHALALLGQTPGLQPIAGGTDLLIRQRHAQREATYLQVNRLPELRGVRMLDDGSLSIGAACTFAELANDPCVLRHIPLLAETALSMGGPQIRNVATVGGNVCNGAVSADSAPALLALDASLLLVHARGERTVPLSTFYLGPGKVDLQAGELLWRIVIPKRPAGEGGCYIKYSMRKAMDIATLGVAAVCTLGQGGRIAALALAAGVMAKTPLRLPSGEQAGVGEPAEDDTFAKIAKAALADTGARTSWRASKEFREHIFAVSCRHAVRQAAERTGKWGK